MSKLSTAKRIRLASIKSSIRSHKRWDAVRANQAQCELVALECQRCAVVTVTDSRGRVTTVETFDFDSDATARRKQRTVRDAMRAAYVR